jgi:hypothetical protein
MLWQKRSKKHQEKEVVKEDCEMKIDTSVERGTACMHCRFLLDTSGGQRAPIWYDLYCTANPEPSVFDPYTGYTGTGKYSGDRYKHIRTVNKGNCQKFEDGGSAS